MRACWRDYPILGVCLGHQTIVAAFGGTISRSPQPMHGRTSDVWHDGQGVFAGVPSPFTACRYHSLIAMHATLPDELAVCGTTPDGLIMAVRHRQRPVVGVQFHPESILTEHGYRMLANFLQMAGLAIPAQLPSLDDERHTVPEPKHALPPVPGHVLTCEEKTSHAYLPVANAKIGGDVSCKGAARDTGNYSHDARRGWFGPHCADGPRSIR